MSAPHLGPLADAEAIPLAAVFRAEGESGYRGWVSLEMRASGPGANIGALESAAETVANARLAAEGS